MSFAAASVSADDPFAPRHAAFRRAQRHSRTVRTLKLLLPSAAVLVALGFGWAAWRSTPAEVAFPAEEAAVSDGKLVMANPKLGGFTQDDEPYAMVAERAIQAIGQEHIVELEAVNATLPLDGRETATVTAPGGTFDRNANRLTLRSTPQAGIAITTSGGTSARFAEAEIDIGTGSMNAKGDVAISGDGTVLTADALAVSEGGKILVFERNVRMTIEAGRVKTAENGDGNANP